MHCPLESERQIDCLNAIGLIARTISSYDVGLHGESIVMKKPAEMRSSAFSYVDVSV